jgi:hypothetical protein
MGKINIPTTPQQEVPQTVSNDNNSTIHDKEVIEIQSAKEDTVSDELIEMIPLRRQLGLDPLSTEQNRELKAISDWGKSKGMNRDDLLKEIKKIEFKLGNIPEESKVKRIYQYLRITSQIDSLSTQLVSLAK